MLGLWMEVKVVPLRDHFPKNGRRPDTLEHTLNVMTYELGSVAHGLIYLINARTMDKENDPDGHQRAYRREVQMGLSDLITQCRILAEQMKFQWADTVELGEERFIERMDEMEKRVI